MPRTDVLFQLEQPKVTTSMSDLHESPSAMPGQLLTQGDSATTSTIMLNCSKLEPINSHGIRLFILLLINVRRQQKHVQICGLSEHNRYIFEITRLNEFVDIIGTKN